MAGDVISQSKGPCTECATSGEAIDLVISSGSAPPARIDVPDVVGDSEAAATATLIGADLTKGNVTTQASETVSDGDVISQSKGPCTDCATSGEAIDLVVSTGPAPPGGSSIPEQIVELSEDVNALGLHHGQTNALNAKLRTALNKVTDRNSHNDDSAVNNLESFINHVNAQSGKKIKRSDANDLIASAEDIIDEF
jgi:beta-lactam-binding protein with PASTA domain